MTVIPSKKQIVMNLIPMALATHKRHRDIPSEGVFVQEYQQTGEEEVDISGDSSGGMDQDPSE